MGRVLKESVNAIIKQFGVDAYDRQQSNEKYQNFAFIQFDLIDADGNVCGDIRKSFPIGDEMDAPEGAVKAWNDFISSATTLKAEAVTVINYYKGL